MALTVPRSNMIKVKYCEHCLPGLWFIKGDGASGEKLAQAQERGRGPGLAFPSPRRVTLGKLLPLSEPHELPHPATLPFPKNPS